MSAHALLPRLSGHGKVRLIENGWRLEIPGGGGSHYRLAQLDDLGQLGRPHFPWRPPVRLHLDARVSGPQLPGTWGFGWWNDPFGSDFSLLRAPRRIPAPPQAAWFFSASQRSYLSFRNDRPANGLLAQVFRSAPGRAWPMLATMCLLANRRVARRILARHIEEDAGSVKRDPSNWHHYEISWNLDSLGYAVDDELILDASTQPQPPLGLVIWIDNQFAAFDPQLRLAWGLEPQPENAWLEIRCLRVGAASHPGGDNCRYIGGQ